MDDRDLKRSEAAGSGVFQGRALICLTSTLVLGLGLGWCLRGEVSIFWILGLLAAAVAVVVLLARWQNLLLTDLAGVLPAGTLFPAIAGLHAVVPTLEPENQGTKERAAPEDRLLPGIMARLEEGVLLFGTGGGLEQFNPAAQRHLGLGAPLAKGMKVGDVFRGTEGLEAIQKAYLGTSCEWRLARAGRTLRVRAIPFAPLGSVSGVLLTLDDVTSQDALETTRQKFISNVSHELKTPVTAISISAENLQEENLSDSARASAESILRSVHRLTLLLGDLSELSRIESGAMNLAPESLDLVSFLDTLMRDLQPRCAACGVQLALNIDAPSGATILVDPLRLHQVIENLVSNAMKFSPPGGQVDLSVHLTSQGQTWEVRDQGPGIPEAEQGRIFERFYRAQAAKAKPGTGLGLAIVKHLCRLMGGEVTVESRPGEGAAFRVMLPPQPPAGPPSR